MARRRAGAFALVLVAACARGGATRPTVAAPPPVRSEFAPLPPERMATLHRAHDGDGGKPVCQACHDPAGQVAGGAIQSCQRCHRFGHSNHPVAVVQPTAPEGLPLLPGGRVACHTCHDPHAAGMKRKGLRKEFNALCTACHARH